MIFRSKFSTQIYMFEPKNHDFKIHVYNFCYNTTSLFIIRIGKPTPYFPHILIHHSSPGEYT